MRRLQRFQHAFPFSYVLASLLLLALVLWMAFGDMQRFRSEPPEASEAADATIRVEVSERSRQPYVPQLVVQGQLEAAQEVELRAKVAGFVEEKPVRLGEQVQAGDTLLVLDQNALPEQLEQARANIALAQSELSGAESLRRRELISQPEYLRLQAALSRSVAEVADLSRQLDDTRPTAPFSGTLDRLDVELGELLQPGETWGRLIDDRTLTGTAFVSQQQVGQLSSGLPVTARLLGGAMPSATLAGTLSHIASRAEEATRSFYIEVSLDNPEQRRLAGSSAEFTVTLPPKQVHAFSPALLTLTAQGDLSVKHLDDDNTVLQTPVTLISADTERAYVTGLPDPVRLITLGAGLAEVGQRVNAVAADALDEATRDAQGER
ncbi:efflux RND transporter periplasmic adaptor subunit [Vreelandella massiliensis]|uniref:efflux RND transporter periplasmic adaptor subunit n=1 Tax=Vreelandella massiliensis TaxID=1816686 RepID=UPI00096AAAD5|nr:efflux RND transporter periplasmic adaptor subunit [Halomonas massiliensis]